MIAALLCPLCPAGTFQSLGRPQDERGDRRAPGMVLCRAGRDRDLELTPTAGAAGRSRRGLYRLQPLARAGFALHHRTVRLDSGRAREVLSRAPLGFTGSGAAESCSHCRCRRQHGALPVEESLIMEPGPRRPLSRRSPTAGGALTIRARTRSAQPRDSRHHPVPARHGLHDPYRRGDAEHHISYFTRDNARRPAALHVPTPKLDLGRGGRPGRDPQSPQGFLRTYRLARRRPRVRDLPQQP
jgi:hypothetical protein